MLRRTTYPLYFSDTVRGEGSMRLKLTEWTGSTADQALAARGMERAEIEALGQHGKYERFRPLRALFELMVNFMTFCRWRGEIHMNGRRIGPVHYRIFCNPQKK